MARYLILDAEAVNALARARDHPKAARRAQAVLSAAQVTGALVRIPAAVLTEVYRGRWGDVEIDWLLRRLGGVLPTTRRTARQAGQLLGREGLDSCHAIDAFVVATAIRLGGGTIATHDPRDLARLAQEHPNIKIAPI